MFGRATRGDAGVECLIRAPKSPNSSRDEPPGSVCCVKEGLVSIPRGTRKKRPSPTVPEPLQSLLLLVPEGWP